MRSTPQTTDTPLLVIHVAPQLRHRPVRRPAHGVRIPAEARRHARSTLFFGPSQRPAPRPAPKLFAR